MKLKHTLIRYLSNVIGWSTNRKIVVFESDDWGSIRMPNLEVYNKLKKIGLPISSKYNNHYNTLDTLASVEDFECLFNTLKSVKDKNGAHPVFTALSLTCNPDFEKIKKKNFQCYYSEIFPKTLNRYGLKESINMWKYGEEEKLFYPEFHGREHLNVSLWMEALLNRDPETLEAFNMNFWGFTPKNGNKINYQAAFALDNSKIFSQQKVIVKEGLAFFEQIHGRKAKFFVPPNGVISQQIIDCSARNGIEFVSSPKIHKEPLDDKLWNRKFRYLGKKGREGLIYLTRNCFFEPSNKEQPYTAEECLNHIEIAFQLKKPAIVSTHRVNYIGSLRAQNRIEGNKSLSYLLRMITKRWKNVEFMTSTELGQLIRKSRE